MNSETLHTNQDQVPVSIEAEQKPKLPLVLQEGLDGKFGATPVYEHAASQYDSLKKTQELHGLSDSDIELLADSHNPFRLKDFSPDQRLRLIEIGEKMTGNSQRDGSYYDVRAAQ